MRRRTTGQKIKDSLFILILGIITAVGFVIIFVNTELGHSYIVQENAQEADQNLTVQKADENRKAKTNYDATKTKSISAKELWRARKYPASPIGRMSIPKVDIHNPVFAGFGAYNQNLSYGVVTVLPDRKMGGKNNYNLAGHYMGGYGSAVLDNLHYIQPGDKIYVTDMHTIYEYTDKNIAYDIKPTQVEVEQNHGNTKMITLITCSDFNPKQYGYGQHRTIAQGVLTNQYDATKENLEKFELTNKSVKTPSTKARTTVKPTTTQKVYNSFNLKKIETIAIALWSIVMLALIANVWRKPKRRRKRRPAPDGRQRQPRPDRPNDPRDPRRPRQNQGQGRSKVHRPNERPMEINPTRRERSRR